MLNSVKTVRRSRFSSLPPVRYIAMRPRLPVPKLRDTLDRYLESLKPFLLEDERRGKESFDSSYARFVRLAQEFEASVGAECQKRLLALDASSPHNWLDDNFWTKKAYHEWRAPLLINSNWWLALNDDPSIPVHQEQSSLSGITSWQIRRAAWMSYLILEFNEKLTTQELHPDTTKLGVWLRESVRAMFGTSRRPLPACDMLTPKAGLDDKNGNDIMVLLHDRLYAITVYENNRLLSFEDIEARMRAVVYDSHKMLSLGKRAVPVSVLSSDDRDKWASNFAHLQKLSGSNQEAIDVIERSLFAVSLDHKPTSSLVPASHYERIGIEPRSLDGHLQVTRSGHNARDRWFDKPFTLSVAPSGQVGVMGEHSPCDALVPSIVAEYATVKTLSDASLNQPLPSAEEYFTAGISPENSGGWRRLGWITDEYIEKECAAAEERAKALIANSDTSGLWFGEYGADWIKNHTKLSPDAYIQMALQLAWYRTRGTFVATYETALTRSFDRGRTETIRTLTADSRAFVLEMCKPDNVDTPAHDQKKFALLQRAVQAHTRLTRAAATGRGIDRHLFGLRLMLRDDELDSSSFFKEPLFTESQQWKLSTSGLSEGHHFRGTGFGAMYEDGYGINYLAGPNVVKFGIESKFSSPLTSTHTFKKAISKAMLDMQYISENAGAIELPLSRL